MNDKTQALATQPIGKLLLEYSIPAIIGSTVMIVYNIIDRIFIGQGVGAYAISGLALTLPITALQTAFGTLIGVGASARISIVLGMKDHAWAERVLAHALMLSILLTTFFIAGVQLFLPELLVLFGGTENTIPYALEYMRIVNAGSIFTTIAYTFCSLMRATGYPRKSMMLMVTGAAINTILDPIFIFVFDMGIRGAAIATVISMAFTAAYALSHYVRPESFIRFHRKAFRFDKKIVRNIVAIGISPFIMNVMVSLVNTLMNKELVRHGGDLAIGAYGIFGSVVMLVIMVMMGVSQGMQPILGYNYGANQMDRLRQTLRLGMIVGFSITTFGFLCGELFPRPIVSIFTRDETLIGIAELGMRICLSMFPLVGVQIVIITFFQSIGWVKTAILLTLSRQLLFLVPLILILSHYYGLEGVFAASPAADLLAFAVAVVALLIQRKKLFKADAAGQPANN